MFHAKLIKGSMIRTKTGMVHRFAELLGVLVVLASSMANPVYAKDRVDDKETDPEVLARLEEYRDWKFGLFIHWDPCSQWGARIAWPLSEPMTWARSDHLKAWVEGGKDFEKFSRDYIALNKTFDPKDFDPRKWADAAKYAGMKYIVFVTKCHDGFSMFRTKQSDYCVTDPSCPFHDDPRADITKCVLGAFRERGFRTGVYFSMPDWHHPDYEDPSLPRVRLFVPNYDVKEKPEKWQRYVRFLHAQVEELMTGYGPLDILWLDGGGGGDCEMPKLAGMAREHQPGLLVVHRGQGGQYENYRTPEQHVPDRALPYAWETCMTMGDYWAYNPDDYFKSARELIHLLVGIVCKGGNLLLDIGPDADGRLPAESLDRLEEIGDWMKYNGEAIYGTRSVAPYQEGRVCFTRRGDAVYLIYLAKNVQTKPPRQVAVSSIQPAGGAEVKLVGRELSLQWEKKDKGVVIRTPDRIACPLRGERPFCRHAWAIKISKAIVHSGD